METIVYYNPSYAEYGECYSVYIKDGGLFKIDKFGTCRILPHVVYDLGEETMDSYMNSRDFVKVLDTDNIAINWYNGFEKQKLEVSVKIKEFTKSIISIMRYSAFDSDRISKGCANLSRLSSMLK